MRESSQQRSENTEHEKVECLTDAKAGGVGVEDVVIARFARGSRGPWRCDAKRAVVTT